MVESKKVIITLVVLLIFGLIGLYIYNSIESNAVIKPSAILAYILIGGFVFAGIKVFENFGVGKLDLDNLLLPLIVVVGIIYLFIQVPSLLTGVFSVVNSDVQPVQSPSSFNLWHLVIPIIFFLFHKRYRDDLRRKLNI